jgi:hypothetical protein
MPNLLDEDLIPFAEGVRSLPGRPHISTGYRFATRGSRGVVLETVLVGGRRYTSRQALRRFVATVSTVGALGNPVVRHAPASTDRTSDGIKRRLDDAGI